MTIHKLHKLLVFTCFAGVALAGSAQGERATAPATAVVPQGAGIKDHEIVPCLLPSRVRKLGGMVYPERRRLTQSTAVKCSLRGGEYTYYDRATPENSVAFFKPLAEAGDPVAQSSLGEVYEYLFAEPRYEEALAWYKKAADQGDNTGLRRLAHLYEQGLGVPQDSLMAANLWRQAIGTSEDLVLASELDAVRTQADDRIEALTQELRSRNAESEELRRDLAVAREEIAERRGSLTRAHTEIASIKSELTALKANGANSDPTRLLALQKDLDDRQRIVDEQRYQIEAMEADLGAQQAQLSASVKRVELENERLQSELGRVTEASDDELVRARTELEAKGQQVAELQSEQSKLLAQLEAQQSRLSVVVTDLETSRAAAGTSQQAAARAQALEAERAEQSRVLAESQARIKELQTQLAGVQTEAERMRSALDQATHERELLDAQLAVSEAELLAARRKLSDAESELDVAASTLTQAQRERQELAAALSSTKAGGAEISRLQAEISERDKQIARVEGRLQEAASQRDEFKSEVDRLREQRTMQLATRSMIDPLPDTSKVKIPRGVKIGKAYALVIGNNNYKNWRSLNFARDDAARVHEALSNGYGFESTLLLDKTATEILTALGELNERLTPDDSLVIYYAGHGIQQQRKSYWVGVDAPVKGPLETTGVSTDTLNGWLSAVNARHVIVVADSCYTGAGIETTGGMKYTANDVEQQLKFYLGNRSRMLISSGGDEPVPDGDAGDGSVFTKVLVALLNENRGVLFADDLFEHLRERVNYARDAKEGVPTPVFARIEKGGHGSGQFVFIRRSVAS